MGMGQGEVSAGDDNSAIKALADQMNHDKLAREQKDAENKTEIARLQKIIEDQTRTIARKNLVKDLEDAAGASTSGASTAARFAIIIEPGHNATDATYVDVGVNGRVYKIQRGPVVEVPPEVIGVLKDAIMGKAVPQEDEKGLPHGVSFRHSRRFPFRVLGKAINEKGERIKKYEDESDLMEM